MFVGILDVELNFEFEFLEYDAFVVKLMFVVFKLKLKLKLKKVFWKICEKIVVLVVFEIEFDFEEVLKVVKST